MLVSMILRLFMLSESEITVSVVVADVLDHLMELGHLAAWKLTLLDVISDKVAKDAAEILVARVA